MDKLPEFKWELQKSDTTFTIFATVKWTHLLNIQAGTCGTYAVLLTCLDGINKSIFLGQLNLLKLFEKWTFFAHLNLPLTSLYIAVAPQLICRPAVARAAAVR